MSLPAPPALLRRRALLLCAAATALPAALALTQNGAKTARGTATAALAQVRVAVGNTTAFMFRHLPLGIAQQLDFFTPEGVRVLLQNHASDPAALQAMQEGRADLCAIDFGQLLRAPGALADGARCFVLQARAPQAALGVSLRSLPDFDTLADLEKCTVGVCALGALSHTVARLALEQAGVAPGAVSFLAVGEGEAALAALRSGRVQALCHGDPLMAQLEHRGAVRIAADTRTLAGTQALFGGPVFGGCLVAPAAMLEQRAPVVQAVTHGVVRALKWLQTAAPVDMVDLLPAAARPGSQRSMALAAFARVRETFSPDGSMAAQGPATVLRALQWSADPAMVARLPAPETTVLHAFAHKAKLKFSA